MKWLQQKKILNDATDEILMHIKGYHHNAYPYVWQIWANAQLEIDGWEKMTIHEIEKEGTEGFKIRFNHGVTQETLDVDSIMKFTHRRYKINVEGRPPIPIDKEVHYVYVLREPGSSEKPPTPSESET